MDSQPTNKGGQKFNSTVANAVRSHRPWTCYQALAFRGPLLVTCDRWNVSVATGQVVMKWIYIYTIIYLHNHNRTYKCHTVSYIDQIYWWTNISGIDYRTELSGTSFQHPLTLTLRKDVELEAARHLCCEASTSGQSGDLEMVSRCMLGPGGCTDCCTGESIRIYCILN